MRFDEDSRVFEISVRELAEDEGFRRVGFDRGDGWRRLGLGTQIHTRVLAERQGAHPAYRAEVHLEARIPVEDWTAVLTGRLDGCIEREPGHWLIEELKSTNLAVDGVRPSGYAFERDRRQLLGYCYLWRLHRGGCERKYSRSMTAAMMRGFFHFLPVSGVGGGAGRGGSGSFLLVKVGRYFLSGKSIRQILAAVGPELYSSRAARISRIVFRTVASLVESKFGRPKWTVPTSTSRISSAPSRARSTR